MLKGMSRVQYELFLFRRLLFLLDFVHAKKNFSSFKLLFVLLKLIQVENSLVKNKCIYISNARIRISRMGLNFQAGVKHLSLRYGWEIEWIALEIEDRWGTAYILKIMLKVQLTSKLLCLRIQSWIWIL